MTTDTVAPSRPAAVHVADAEMMGDAADEGDDDD